MTVPTRKILSWILIVLLVLNLIFFALSRISVLLFWTVIIICALLAYQGLPRLKD